MPSKNSITHYVFLLHGIRTYAAWTDPVANSFRSCPPMNQIEVEKFNYGHFLALEFILPCRRKALVKKFTQHYIDARNKYPTAQFHCVAHSNGSYIFGHSLLANKCDMEFESAYLVGSVLDENFPWSKIGENNQLQRLKNIRATKDFPVAILCQILRCFFFQNLGVAGFRGFQDTREFDSVNSKWLKGGHSSGLMQCYHESIAAWIITGQLKNYIHTDYDDSPNKYYCFLSTSISTVAKITIAIIKLAVIILLGFLLCKSFSLF